MCNCVKQIEENIKNHISEKDKYKKPVLKVRLKDAVFSIAETVELKTVSNFEVELEGQKKKPVIPLAHSFCPFCGERNE